MTVQVAFLPLPGVHGNGGGMGAEDPLSRPIGWWLKEADTRIEAAFQAALEGTGVDRRRWQLLSSLARGPVRQDKITAGLRGFDDAAALDLVVKNLIERGWVERTEGRLLLTPQGEEKHSELVARVDRVRQRVVAALPRDDYVTLVTLLARLVQGFEEEKRPPDTPVRT
ncbi:MAG: MarR family winged helix-turn-helix transcriptional regulator [Nitriliruptorales bacterium]